MYIIRRNDGAVWSKGPHGYGFYQSDRPATFSEKAAHIMVKRLHSSSLHNAAIISVEEDEAPTSKK